MFQRLQTKAEIAEFLGVSAKTVKRMMDDGAIPYRLVRNAPRFILSDVLDSLPVCVPTRLEFEGLAEHPEPTRVDQPDDAVK